LEDRSVNEMSKYLRRLDRASEEKGYVFRTPEDVAQAEKLGYVEVNRELVDDLDTMFACRVTERGMLFAYPEGKETKAEPTLIVEPANPDNYYLYRTDPPKPTANEPKKETHMEIQIENVPMPEKRTRKKRELKYPFESLEVGQSFFVDVEPKAITGSVINANARFAVATGETRVNRKGKTVPVMIQTRKFQAQADEKDGVQGTRIGRIL
jgi:hypothetical protein